MTTNRISENVARNQWHGPTGGTNHDGQMLRMIILAEKERKERKEGRGVQRGQRGVWSKDGGVPGGGENENDKPPPLLCLDDGILIKNI